VEDLLKRRYTHHPKGKIGQNIGVTPISGGGSAGDGPVVYSDGTWGNWIPAGNSPRGLEICTGRARLITGNWG